MAAENILASSFHSLVLPLLLVLAQSCPATTACPVLVYRPVIQPKKNQFSMDTSLEDIPYYKQYAVMIPKDYIRGVYSKLFLLITTVTNIKQ